MDEIVLRSLAKWPDVPDVYGWLALDRRGQWRIRGERIGNAALREFIGRNYQPDPRGCWFFQNGPQRVFVQLACAPWVVHWAPGSAGDVLLDHCGQPFAGEATYLDDGGSVLVAGRGTVALLDDRDLARYAESGASLPTLRAAALGQRFGFIPEPAP